MTKGGEKVVKRHRLDRMINAQSIAIVGASARPGSFGLRMVQAVTSKDFKGKVFFVNPSYDELDGQTCYPNLEAIGEPCDMAILGVGSRHMEAVFTNAIEAGIGSAVIYDDCYGGLTIDNKPMLQRLRDLSIEADVPVCGGNCMGFVNVTDRVFASYYPADHLKPGKITLIAHSGSIFTELTFNDQRYRFDFAISPGQEIGTTVDEYIDYALSRESTGVIAVFMESARNPQNLVEVLEKAREKKIPVVICKVGKTDESAKMAQSHTGALVGSFYAYAAAMKHCGAITVNTVDQLMNTALLLSQGRMPTLGGLATVTDSGGLREMAMDRSEELKIPLANITPELHQKLKAVLPDVLPPSNPLDCLIGLPDGYHKIFADGLQVFADAPEVSVVGAEIDLRDDFVYADELLTVAKNLPNMTTKPCFIYSSFAQTNNKELAEMFIQRNIPLINGFDEMLYAVQRLLDWRDLCQFREEPADLVCKPENLEKWKRLLSSETRIDEYKALELLSDFGINSVVGKVCDTWHELREAAEIIGYPLVLKTAADGIEHKSDVKGVYLNLDSETALQQAYKDIHARLGARVLAQTMAPNGLELAFGCVVDQDFGPVVMVAAGGVLVEVLKDRRFAIAPFGETTAINLLNDLASATLMDGVRGAPAVNKKLLACALSRFSRMCSELGEHFKEIDVNPVIVNQDGMLAVDALIIRV